MKSPFCFMELHSNDVDKSLEFYSKLLGWEPKNMPMADGKDYHFFGFEDSPEGGIMKNQAPEGTPSHWISYIKVEDIVESSKRTEELGGTILHPVTEIPEYGQFCVVQDNVGAVFSLWQNKE